VPRFAFGAGIGGGVGGGVGGGGGGNEFARLERFSKLQNAPAAGLVLKDQMGMATKVDRLSRTDEPAAPRVRSYFPEALYINSEIVTDQHGNATIAIPMADSITTWRMAMMASTTRGGWAAAHRASRSSRISSSISISPSRLPRATASPFR
jgi:Alpha-2-macroglobulin family